MDERKEQLVERLLRAERGVELAPDFKQQVMARLERLPAPELLAPHHGWRDWIYALRLLSSGEKIALGLIIVGIIVMLLPGARELLLAAQWELAGLELSLSIGESAVSASLASVIAVIAGALFMTGVGAFAARNHLIGA